MSDTNGEYHPLSGSPWHPANEPPKQTEWVIARADGAVRCVAWNGVKHCWEDWDGHGALNLDGIEWWMSIPDAPDRACEARNAGSVAEWAKQQAAKAGKEGAK